MFFGAAIVIALVRHGGDDRRLVVVPAMGDDTGLLADIRTRPVSADQKARRDGIAIGELHIDGAGRVGKGGHGGCAQLDANGLRLRHQRVDEMPVLDHVREGLASSTSPPKVSRVGRTASSSLESVTTMSRMGWASTPSQTSIASNSRRAAAAIAVARRSFDLSFDLATASAGSATMTAKLSPSAWRSAIPSARPAKPAPPTRTSALRCGMSITPSL